MRSQAEQRFLAHAIASGVRIDDRAPDASRSVVRERSGTLCGVDASSSCQIGEAQVLCFTRALDAQKQEEEPNEAEAEVEATHTKIQYIPTSLAPHNRERLAYCQSIVSMLSRNTVLPKGVVLYLSLLAYGPSYCTAASIAVADCLRQLDGTFAPLIFVGAWKLGGRWICDASLVEEESAEASVLALLDREGQVQDISKHGSCPITVADLDAALEICRPAAQALYTSLYV